MENKFINRKPELEFLNDKYKQKKFHLIVFYGRRRIGKSELITHFCRDKPHLYFLANKRGTKNNVNRFVELSSKLFNDFKPEINNFEESFKYIIKKSQDKRFIICIDEFSYLIEKDPEIVSDFQLIVDIILKNSNIMLIFCGSSISMMEKGILGYKSPLYGRRTGQWRVKPFKLRDLFSYYNTNIENFIKILSVFGDIPAYFLIYDKSKDIYANIKEKILKKGEFLYKEPEILLREELKEPDTYFDVLKATSYYPKPSDISNLAGIPGKDISKYFKNLSSIDIIEKINPVISKKEITKTSLYLIKDNYFNFWFKFVYPNISQLEEARSEEILNLIKSNYEILLQKYFEVFCQKLLIEKILMKDFNFTKIGKQWGRIPRAPKGENQYEIDICAINEQENEILFGECKWKNNVNAKKIANEIENKSKFVNWKLNKRKEIFVIFAKSFKEKINEFEGRKVYCFELKDIEERMKRF